MLSASSALPMRDPPVPFEFPPFVVRFGDRVRADGPSPPVRHLSVVRELNLDALLGVIEQFRIDGAMVLPQPPKMLFGPRRVRLADVPGRVERIVGCHDVDKGSRCSTRDRLTKLRDNHGGISHFEDQLLVPFVAQRHDDRLGRIVNISKHQLAVIEECAGREQAGDVGAEEPHTTPPVADLIGVRFDIRDVRERDQRERCSKSSE
jgi:hypothetical protein